MKIFSETNIGKKRRTNQDSYIFKKISDTCCWSVVCDGMGGANGGDIASQLACLEIEKFLKKNANENMSDEEMMRIAFDSIFFANEKIYQKSLDSPALKGMGTTVVQVLINNKKMGVSNVGDSRVYLKRGNQTSQITVDHSFVQDLVSKNQITKEEAKNHPLRNIITRSLGAHESVENDYSQIDIEDGDIIVLCTDGLSGYMSEDLLDKYLDKYKPEKITKKLIDFALKCGGLDNITVSVIYL